MQTHCFQAGRIQKRQVQTGTQLLLQYHIAQAYTLTYPFKAGGRHHIGNCLLFDCGKDGSCLAQHPVRILGLIAIHGGIACPLAQVICSTGNDSGQFRMIGCYKSCQQLRIKSDTMPFIKGKHCRFCIIRKQYLILCLQLNVQNTGNLFGHTRQILSVQD